MAVKMVGLEQPKAILMAVLPPALTGVVGLWEVVESSEVNTREFNAVSTVEPGGLKVCDQNCCCCR